jgi:hypothetical protein
MFLQPEKMPQACSVRNRRNQGYAASGSTNSKTHGILPELQQIDRNENRNENILNVGSPKKKRNTVEIDSASQEDTGVYSISKNDHHHQRQQTTGQRSPEATIFSTANECTVADYRPINAYLGSLHSLRRRQRARQSLDCQESPSNDSQIKVSRKKVVQLHSDSKLL